MFTRRGTVIRTSSGRTSACLRGRVRMHSSRESAGAQRARGFRTCVFERANQLERRSPTTPCPNRRTCSWTRVRFTRKLYGMIPKPLARTSAAGGHEIKLAERLHSDQSTFTSGCSAVLFVPMMTADVDEQVNFWRDEEAKKVHRQLGNSGAPALARSGCAVHGQWRPPETQAPRSRGVTLSLLPHPKYLTITRRAV